MSKSVAMNTSNNVIQAPFKRNVFARLAGRVIAWNKRRAAIRELRAMPDVLLQDIGIERYQIAEVVNGSGSLTRLHTSQIGVAVVAPLRKAAA